MDLAGLNLSVDKKKIDRYDIIGDIHAHADTLQTLLEKLGYHRQNRRIIQRFKPMVEQKTAYTILGNHEYDAICFHTYGEDRKTPLRAHSKKHSATSNSFCENIILTPKNRKRSLTGSKPTLIFGARWVSSYPRLLVPTNLRSNEGLFR